MRGVTLLVLTVGCGEGRYVELGASPAVAPERLYTGAVTLVVGPGAIEAQNAAGASIAAVAFPSDTAVPIGSVDLPTLVGDPPVSVGGDGVSLSLRIARVQLEPLVSGVAPALVLHAHVLAAELPAQAGGTACEAHLPGSSLTIRVPLTLGRDLLGHVLVSPSATTIVDPSSVRVNLENCEPGGLDEVAGTAVTHALEVAVAAHPELNAAIGRTAQRLLGADLPVQFEVTRPDGAAISATLLSSPAAEGEPLVVSGAGTAVLPLSLALRVTPSPCAARWLLPPTTPELESPPADALVAPGMTLVVRRDAVRALATAALNVGALCATAPIDLGPSSALPGLVPADVPGDASIVARLVPMAAATLDFTAMGAMTISVPNALVELFVRTGDFDRRIVAETGPVTLGGVLPMLSADRRTVVLRAPAGAPTSLAQAVLAQMIDQAPLLPIPDRFGLPILAASVTVSESHWLIALDLDTTARPTWSTLSSALEGAASVSAPGCSSSDRAHLGTQWGLIILAIALGWLARRHTA